MEKEYKKDSELDNKEEKEKRDREEEKDHKKEKRDREEEKEDFKPQYNYQERIDQAKDERIRLLKEDGEMHRNNALKVLAEFEEYKTRTEKTEKENEELKHDIERYRKLIDNKPVGEHRKEAVKDLDEIFDSIEHRKVW